MSIPGCYQAPPGENRIFWEKSNLPEVARRNELVIGNMYIKTRGSLGMKMDYPPIVVYHISGSVHHSKFQKAAIPASERSCRH
jgi:hypothetical protein